jgi:hypothetical protein
MALTPEPAPTRTYDTSWRRARRSSGQVLNDQDGRLVGVIVANANDLERPFRPERDRVAGPPVHDHRVVITPDCALGQYGRATHWPRLRTY